MALYERRGEGGHGDLAQFEQIKKIALLPREFSLEAGELTPTLKVKRRVVEQKYKDMIDRMYEGRARALGHGRAAARSEWWPPAGAAS